MTKIASINLDIRKNSTIDNEPIVLRQGDSDVTIEASISNDGYPNVKIDFATFAAKKPDGTIISNDPANVSGNTISYPISKHLTDSVGKIHDAYFMINNKITTSGFDISIIPSAQLDENSVNYFPGLEDINKLLKSTETDWLGRIQQMKSQIAGLDIPTEFKLLMDKALSDAKAQYQPIIDAAQENVENIAADLAAKKLDLENNSDGLNATITAIKAQVASITSFLDGIQKQIIEANTSFTAGQQAQISQSIADSQKKLADSIASMQSKVAQSISDLKAQTDALVSGSAFQSLQAQVNNSAVGTNLLLKTYESVSMTGNNTSNQWIPSYLLSRGIEKGTTVTLSFDAVSTVPTQFSIQNDGHNSGYWLYYLYHETTDTTKKHYVATVNPDEFLDNSINIRFDNVPSTTTITISNMKLELGSHATDYSLNPLDIVTNDGVQAEIAEQIKANQPDLSGFQTQAIFKSGDYVLNRCPNGTDFGAFLKSNSVPLGLSIIKDQNANWNWRIIKESNLWIYGLSQDGSGTVYHLEVNNGTFTGIKTVMSNLTGKTITAADDTGKTVNLKITGIS